MITPAQVGRADPKVFRQLAAALEEQLAVGSRLTAMKRGFTELSAAVEQTNEELNAAWERHLVILDELEQAALELSDLTINKNQQLNYSSSLIIDNVIVEVEIQFEVLTRNGNARRSINHIAIKRDGERIDIVSQNSKTLVVFEDTELIMDIAINSLEGATTDDTLRFVMTAIERWTLEHRHDNHFDLVITFLLKCKVIVHPEERVVNPTPVPVATPITRAAHTRTCVSHNTTFYREGHYRTSRYGVRYWVEGHWVTR